MRSHVGLGERNILAKHNPERGAGRHIYPFLEFDAAVFSMQLVILDHIFELSWVSFYVKREMSI
jgi:hypothetical protein